MADFVRRKIVNSKSVGEILKAARKRKQISLTDAEEEIKVRTKYLEALEEGRFDILPGSVYTLGFLAKYADFLNLDKDKIITQFRAEFGDNRYETSLVPERKIRESIFFITPKFITITVIVLVLLGIFGYIIYSVRQFTEPPNLEISSPSAEQVLKESKVDIIGKTDEGATLSINNQVVLLDGNGNFRQQVKLSPGLNTFELRAINRLKKETTKQIKILAEF